MDMLKLVERYKDEVSGVVSCFDRVNHRRGISAAKGSARNVWGVGADGQGEFCISGMKNKTVRKLLPGRNALVQILEQRRTNELQISIPSTAALLSWVGAALIERRR